ncbi:MAG: hypothetical protein M3O94_06330 [Actinomycetota bacterium]|nr:hypothetical protein [Actinomycetota bacterium]
MREHWREVDYWRWLWHRQVPFEAKVLVGVVMTALMLGGGWFAADRLTAAHAGATGTDSFVLERTVRKVVVVTERGKVIRRLVPVVTKVKVRLPGKTSYDTRTRTTYKSQVVTIPGKARVIRRLVTTYVPVVKRRVVRVNGKTHTLVETRLVPTTRTQTETQTHEVTNLQTVTNTQDVVQTVVQTVTKTTTLPAVTVTVTETVTETKTVTDTETVTVTDTVTTTETETVTVTTTTHSGP